MSHGTNALAQDLAPSLVERYILITVTLPDSGIGDYDPETYVDKVLGTVRRHVQVVASPAIASAEQVYPGHVISDAVDEPELEHVGSERLAQIQQYGRRA